MKKYMIRCDIEGVSGVVSYEQAEPGKPEFVFGLYLPDRDDKHIKGALTFNSVWNHLLYASTSLADCSP